MPLDRARALKALERRHHELTSTINVVEVDGQQMTPLRPISHEEAKEETDALTAMIMLLRTDGSVFDHLAAAEIDHLKEQCDALSKAVARCERRAHRAETSEAKLNERVEELEEQVSRMEHRISKAQRVLDGRE